MRILYFAPLYYDDMKQRPQQIAECLSARHEVFYVEPTISLIRWLLLGGRPFWGGRKRMGRQLHILRLNGALTFHKSIEILDVAGINNLSEWLQIKKLADSCDVIWTGYSGWYTLIRHFKDKPVIWDKMDEEDLLVQSRLLKKTLRRDKKKLMERADGTVVTSRIFYKEMKKHGKQTYLVANAVSASFSGGRAAFGPIGRVKVFGYIGTIAEWFDMSVIQILLESDESYEVVLAGRNYMEKLSHPRLHYLGIKKNSELPGLISQMDVCLYNFKQTRLLDTVNPVKIYEYLSMNKPVLAVNSRETRRLASYVTLYDTPDEIKKLAAGKWKRPFENKKELDAFVAENCWHKRAETIEGILAQVRKDFNGR